MHVLARPIIVMVAIRTNLRSKPVTETAQEHPAERADGEADEVGGEAEDQPGRGVAAREEQRPEHQRGGQAVERPAIAVPRRRGRRNLCGQGGQYS
jgi:hypothetical protein